MVVRSVESPTRLTGKLPPTPKRPPQYGYQPTNGNLNKSDPPTNGSCMPKHQLAETCPVCNGTGHVDANFYNLTKRQWSVPGGTVSCRSCNGKGFVVI